MPRQRIDELFNGSASATDRIALEQLREENKECYYNRRKKLPDRERRQKRDGHRKLHGHTTLEEVFPRLLIDRKSADHGSGECEPVTGHEWAPPTGQAGNDNDTHQSQPHIFSGPGFVFMIVIVVTILMVTMIMVITVVLIVHYLAGGMNGFARRLHCEESSYFRYLLMTSTSSSAAAAP